MRNFDEKMSDLQKRIDLMMKSRAMQGDQAGENGVEIDSAGQPLDKRVKSLLDRIAELNKALLAAQNEAAT